MPQRSTVAFVLIALFVAWPRQAHAYLDPASGSLLLQIILGGVAGLALFFKLFWHKIRSMFGMEIRDDDESSD